MHDKTCRKRSLAEAAVRTSREGSAHCAACCAFQGDAEDLPFPTDSFDRYVSAGSIEYWPEPQRGIKEAYR